MRSKLAIWSLISVISIFVISYSLSMINPPLFTSNIINWIALVLYLVPLGLGISALVFIKKDKNLKGKGFAITGIVLSSILFIIGLLSILLFLLAKKFQLNF